LSKEATEDEAFNDSPIITYSNRIQKHMFLLTEELSLNNTVELREKRRLRLIIANLPPEGKEKLTAIYAKCETQDPITAIEFDKIYSEVSDWIYTNILQDAFRAKPKFKGTGKL
jgi:hypothetical protein